MAILKVAHMGHPVLRAEARPLAAAEIRSEGVQRLIDDMLDTMREYHGIGLAAPQVHESVRLFVAVLNAALVLFRLSPTEEICWLVLLLRNREYSPSRLSRVRSEICH